MKYVVDVQGFKLASNEFVFKEVAVVALEDDPTPQAFLFEPPVSWKEMVMRDKCLNRWLERNFHGLPWDKEELPKASHIPYKEVGNTVREAVKDAEVVFVKGLEKTQWVRNILPNVMVRNIEEMGCPALKILPMDESCSSHKYLWKKKAICAVANSIAIVQWILKFRFEDPLLHLMYT